MSKAIQSPGSVLKALIAEYQLNPNKMAKEIGLSNSSVRQIVFEKSKISVPVALRLAKYFDPPASYWLDLQRDFDLQAATKDQELQNSLKSISKAKKAPPVDKKAAKAAPADKKAKDGSAAKKTTAAGKRKEAAKAPGAKPAARSRKS